MMLKEVEDDIEKISIFPAALIPIPFLSQLPMYWNDTEKISNISEVIVMPGDASGGNTTFDSALQVLSGDASGGNTTIESALQIHDESGDDTIYCERCGGNAPRLACVFVCVYIALLLSLLMCLSVCLSASQILINLPVFQPASQIVISVSHCMYRIAAEQAEQAALDSVLSVSLSSAAVLRDPGSSTALDSFPNSC